MRLFSYKTAASNGIGVLVVPPDSETCGLFSPIPDLSMLELIEMGEKGLELARTAMGTGPRMLAPIPNLRRNIFGLGWNYAEHSKETAHVQEVKTPKRPVFFTKTTGTLNTPYGDIPIDPRVSEQYDWEVELGVIVGVAGKNIPRASAMEHIFGYTVVNDVSARDVQMGHGGQFFKGKSLDGTCPMGPWIVTSDEIVDPHDLKLRCRVNGQIKQEGRTSDLIFDIPAILEWLSLGLTLLPGDVISSGTPAGVGFVRTPPEFLRNGDLVECEVDGIGTLRNRVVSV
jgi:2-keto-4-pentenoate hydratase/2-oxohepta-3-ene-1,7-dioic acid hydratase in catechol pathway